MRDATVLHSHVLQVLTTPPIPVDRPCKSSALGFKRKLVRRHVLLLSRFSGNSARALCSLLATNITFFNKDETLLVTITGRPEQVRVAQAQLLRELQKPVKLAANVPFEFHRYIIGPRGATLKQLELDTLTRIAVPSQDSQSNAILITGAKDNVKLCEQKILEIYNTQANKGYERLSIPYLYHPWIRKQFVEELRRQLKVTIDLPPPSKQTDEISIRGEREPVEQARQRIMEFYKILVSLWIG